LLLKLLSYYQTCSLPFKNNFCSIECFRFPSKIIWLLLKVFASLQYQRKHHYRSFRSLPLLSYTLLSHQILLGCKWYGWTGVGELEGSLIVKRFLNADSAGNIAARAVTRKIHFLLYFQNLFSVFRKILKGQGLFHVTGTFVRSKIGLLVILCFSSKWY
jgi:hypothetical protein